MPSASIASEIVSGIRMRIVLACTPQDKQHQPLGQCGSRDPLGRVGVRLLAAA